MKRGYSWIGVCTALAFAVFVTSCDDSPMSTPEQTTTVAPETAAPETAAPSFDVGAFGPAYNCMGDRAATEQPNDPGKPFVQGMKIGDPTGLNCTANDVVIALADVISCSGCTNDPGAPFTCVEGTTLTIEATVDLQSNAQQRRSDVGWWIAEDGGNAETGTCQHFYFDITGSPTGLDDLDGPPDVCGDIGAKDEFFNIPLDKPVTTFDVICQDTNDDQQLDAGACTGWKVPGDDEVCPDDLAQDGGTAGDLDYAFGTLPANKAKCRCDAIDFPVGIERSAKVTVIKDLNPASDPGKFDLIIKDYQGTQVAKADDVGDTGNTSYTFTWLTTEEGTKNFASVLEEVGNPNPGLQFYGTSYLCQEDFNGTATDVFGQGVGPANLTLANKDNWVCTYVNNRKAAPTYTVSKTAVPTYTREWDWTITKKAYYTSNDVEIPSGTVLGAGPPIAMPGMTYDIYYLLAVNPTPTDKNFAVSGVITVNVSGTNFPPYSGTMTVTDVLAGPINATVDCDGTAGAPIDNTKLVNSAGSFTCTYSATLPDKTTRLNTATAAITWNSGDKDSQNGTKSVVFGSPTTETDETAHICDDKGTPSVSDPCTAASGDYLFSRTRVAGTPFKYDNDTPACSPPGDNRLNTARLTEADTDTDRDATHALSWVCQAPPPGCTLTQGYWKTHSEFGPAPYDDNWNNVTGTGVAACSDGEPDSNGVGTGASVAFDDFFGTGVVGQDVCYHDIFWTPPKGGNSWYQLAHQYIAAQLNVLNGAGTTAQVDAALLGAEALLASYANKRITKKSDDEGFARDYARTLTQYNEGDIGPGHCDDDQYPDNLFY